MAKKGLIIALRIIGELFSGEASQVEDNFRKKRKTSESFYKKHAEYECTPEDQRNYFDLFDY